jgi:hypothetical protein
VARGTVNDGVMMAKAPDVLEAADLEGKGRYYFRGPLVRGTGTRFEGQLVVVPCAFAGCKRLISLTAPFCCEHLLVERGVEVSKSGLPNGGFGLFTRRPIKRGSLIVEYLGDLIDTWTVEQRYGENTAPYAVRLWETSLVVDGALRRSAGAMANSSEAPNAEFEVRVTGDDETNRRVGLWLVATDDIDTNTEISAAYCGGRDETKGHIDNIGDESDDTYSHRRHETWTTWTTPSRSTWRQPEAEQPEAGWVFPTGHIAKVANNEDARRRVKELIKAATPAAPATYLKRCVQSCSWWNVNERSRAAVLKEKCDCAGGRPWRCRYGCAPAVEDGCENDIQKTAATLRAEPDATEHMFHRLARAESYRYVFAERYRFVSVLLLPSYVVMLRRCHFAVLTIRLTGMHACGHRGDSSGSYCQNPVAHAYDRHAVMEKPSVKTNVL